MKAVMVALLATLLLAIAQPAMADSLPESEALQNGLTGGISVVGDAGTVQLSGNSIDGCRANTKYVEYQNIFHNWLWRFYQRVEWCYNGSYVSSASATNWPTFSSQGWNWYYRGIVSNADTACGRGHYSCVRQRTGLFELCFLKYGCIARHYPWHRHVVYANGQFTWKGGTG